MCVWDLPKEKRLCRYCTFTNCPERNLSKKRYGSVISALRSMEVSDVKKFENSYYSSCRVAASRLRDLAGTRFLVSKVNDEVVVTRIT